MPTLKQLKALTLISQTSSFTKAAERLFITQSAVSVLIRELEDEIGAELVSRGRTVSLTEAGEHLMRAGSRADMEIERAIRDISHHKLTNQTVLRVAAGALSAASLLPQAMKQLRVTAPQLKISLSDRPVGMLGDMLLSGEADVVVGAVDSPLRSSAELQSTLLFEDSISVVCARDADLAERAEQRGGLTWKDLSTAELILVGRAEGQWNLLLQEQLAAYDGLSVGFEVQLLSTAIELAGAGLGVAVLPAFATRQLDARIYVVAPLLQTTARWRASLVTRKSIDAPRKELIGALGRELKLVYESSRR